MKNALRLAAALLAVGPVLLHGQAVDPARATIHISNAYRVVSNIVYLTTGGVESKLDVYQSRDDASMPHPTLIWIHGGNWVGGSKEASALTPLPFLERGWNVVNVDYRLLNIAPAPASAEDCRCALRWVYQHAKDYNIDTNRLVVSGNSAGGHLALLIAMVTADAGFDTKCPGAENLKVAGVINWYGFPDLVDLLDGENARPAVQNWIGSGASRVDLAKRLSPMTYVRPGVPPVLTVHGDADPTSPYVHAKELRDALTKTGVRNELVTIPGGKHGGFTDDETLKIYTAIWNFFSK